MIPIRSHGYPRLSVIPDPVAVDVNEFDADAMRADYLAHCHGVPRPWLAVSGIAYLAVGLLNWTQHTQYWYWVLFGLAWIAMSLRPGKAFPTAVLPTGLRFSADGLDIDVPFVKDPRRHYSWRGIRRIDDVGESFVLVPTFGKRVVITKRSFPDGGHEAWAFFAANHVAGRTPLALA
jgi:hypothetical protein